MMEKLEVILHVGDTVVVKLWRFDSSKIVEYRGSYAKLLVFFPDVQKKGPASRDEDKLVGTQDC